MLVVQVGHRVDVEVTSRVNSGVKDHTCPTAPVAIDVLWPRGTHTSHFVERHLVADGIARGVEAQPRRDGALIALCVVVVEEAEVLSERGLQTRVTLTDVHRVAVVGDVEQVAHRGLVGPGIILHTHLADLTALPAEVDGRGEVRHRTRGVGMKTLVVLGEVGLLRHEAHAGIEVERLPHDAQHDLGCMDIVFVFGVSAQILIEIGVDGAVGLEVGVPGAEIGSPI